MKTFNERFRDSIDRFDRTVVLDEDTYNQITSDAKLTKAMLWFSNGANTDAWQDRFHQPRQVLWCVAKRFIKISS